MGSYLLFTADINGCKLTENVIDPYGNIIVSKRYEEVVQQDIFGHDVIVDWTVAYFTINTDIRGSVTSIIRPDGTLASGYIYDEFGNQIKTGDNDFINDATYTGAIFDQETNLVYMNSRYYDSSSGRFISQDTYKGAISNPQTQHLYSYTSNNPINFIDPTGHVQQNANEGGGGNTTCNLNNVASLTKAATSSSGSSSGSSFISVGPLSGKKTESLKKENSTKPIISLPDSFTIFQDGEIRLYGKDGRAMKDIHYKHKNHHPELDSPHEHDIEWEGDTPQWLPPVGKKKGDSSEIALLIIIVGGIRIFIQRLSPFPSR